MLRICGHLSLYDKIFRTFRNIIRSATYGGLCGIPHNPPNRTCGFPASGSPVGSCLSHTERQFGAASSYRRSLAVPVALRAPAPRSCTASPAVPLPDAPPGPARRSLAFRPAWSLSRPGRPFYQSASIHVVTSMNRSGRYQPERQLLGGIRTRQESAPFHGALYIDYVHVDPVGSCPKRSWRLRWLPVDSCYAATSFPTTGGVPSSSRCALSIQRSLYSP